MSDGITRLSVTIPFYNAARTLRQCLNAVYDSDYKNFEVIAINDYSNDNSGEIAKSFPCTVLSAGKKGESCARNEGMKKAAGDIIVSIDSDVVVKKDTLSRIEEAFAKNSRIAALVGVLSKEHPNKNFFSQYKNLYMHYIFNKMPDYVNFLYGSVFAVRKRAIEDFDTKRLHYAPDTELGLRVHDAGGKILLDKKLEVMHLKKYTFVSFLRNDFRIPFSWADSFIKHKGYEYLFKERRFAHARLSQIVSVVLSPVLLAFFFIFGKTPLFLPLFLTALAVIFILNFDFMVFLNRERGPLFFIKSLFVMHLDYFVMFLGVASGFVYTLTTVRAQKAYN
ncbi:MAG: glycosyltransferase family 2 protein [Candidatus Omnitrophica bacterium]|nr:glycosyltransferase family 2 protein [Candidatus Omnitrophota bacterium]